MQCVGRIQHCDPLHRTFSKHTHSSNSSLLSSICPCWSPLPGVTIIGTLERFLATSRWKFPWKKLWFWWRWCNFIKEHITYCTYLLGWHCVISITVSTWYSNCFKFQAESWRNLRNCLVFTFKSSAVISSRKLKIGWVWGARVKVNKVINMKEGMCTGLGSWRACTVDNSTYYCWILPSCFPVGHWEIVIQIIRTVVVNNLSSPVIASTMKKKNTQISINISLKPLHWPPQLLTETNNNAAHYGL